jgi:putative ABC transport system permease protein
MGAFAGMGLLLVIIGVYSVMAYMVALRTHEIGVRAALGAQPGVIVWMVLKRSSGMIMAGILIGVFGSLCLTHLLASQLWGASATDPWTFVSVVVCI